MNSPKIRYICVQTQSNKRTFRTTNTFMDLGRIHFKYFNETPHNNVLDNNTETFRVVLKHISLISLTQLALHMPLLRNS